MNKKHGYGVYVNGVRQGMLWLTDGGKVRQRRKRLKSGHLVEWKLEQVVEC